MESAAGAAEDRVAPPGMVRALERGWAATWAHFGALAPSVLVLALAVVAFVLLSLPPLGTGSADTIVPGAPAYAYAVLVVVPLSVGVAWAALRAVREEGPGWGDVLAPFRRYADAVAVVLLFWAAVVTGLVLFVIPGVILFLRLSFAPLVLMDEGVGPIAALRASWRLTGRHHLRLLALYVAAVFILQFGTVLFLVGVVPAAILVACAQASYYDAVATRALPKARTDAA